MTWEAMLAISLCAYRITRLIVDDSIWEESRERFLHWLRWSEDPPLLQEELNQRNWLIRKVAEMLSCPFCAGFYVTVLIFAWWSWLPGWQWVIWMWAAVGAQALLSSWEGE